MLLGPTIATLGLSVQIPMAAGADLVMGHAPWMRSAKVRTAQPWWRAWADRLLLGSSRKNRIPTAWLLLMCCCCRLC